MSQVEIEINDISNNISPIVDTPVVNSPVIDTSDLDLTHFGR